MAYFSCYMAPIKKADLEAYGETARETAAIFKSLGALQVNEFLADDPVGDAVVAFPQVLRCAPDEVVVFGWVIWPSREVFEACNAELAKNPRAIASTASLDMRRLITGAFHRIEA